jgi:hypothetical protein
MFPLNPAIISALFTSKLDEIIKGQAPDGFKVKETTADSIHLVPENIGAIEGVTFKKLHIEITYKNQLIILSHD